MQEKEFNTIVTEKERDGQFHFNSSSVDVIAKDYELYMRTLKEWRGDMQYDRKVDQALWAYGHLFNENKINEKRGGIKGDC